MLKLHTVTSEGVATHDPITVAITHPDTGKPSGCVVIVETATPKEWREIQRKHTHPEKNSITRGIDKVTDTDAAFDELLSRKIRSWTGIVGADDQPLPVIPAVIERLDPRMKAQLFEAILGAEFTDDSPEVRAESFRESA